MRQNTHIRLTIGGFHLAYAGLMGGFLLGDFSILLSEAPVRPIALTSPGLV
jgi:hypothetical protein